MLSSNYDSTNVYTDFTDINKLKLQAKDNPDKALEKVARQFEALFTQTLLKSMRDSQLSEDGLFDNDQSRMYQDIYDKQLSNDLSNRKGLGLADMLIRQLSNKNISPRQNTNTDIAHAKIYIKNSPASKPDQHLNNFVNKLYPLATRIEQEYKIPATVIVAQAVLETGWGQYVPKNRDGSSSHNLFGIKAGDDWAGDTVSTTTNEYISGKAISVKADFRSYSSYQDSMIDYAEFITNRPRYQQALQYASDPLRFATEIQKAGYATDPEYAEKVNNLMLSDDFTSVFGDFKNSSV